jgi:hypothetical protein
MHISDNNWSTFHILLGNRLYIIYNPPTQKITDFLKIILKIYG